MLMSWVWKLLNFWDTNVKFRNGSAQAGPYIKFKGCEIPG